MPEPSPHTANPTASEATLFYAPPYERPVEDELAWHLVKFLHPDAGVSYQVRTLTAADAFYVDFVVTVPLAEREVRVAIEVTDELDPENVHLRDAFLVGSGHFDAVVRLDPDDLAYRMHDVLLFVLRLRPELFGQRGTRNLETLASTEALIHDTRPGRGVQMHYQLPDAHSGLLFGGEALPENAGAGRTLRVAIADAGHASSYAADYFAACEFFGVPHRSQTRRAA